MPRNALTLTKNDLPKIPRELQNEPKLAEAHKAMLKALGDWETFAREVKRQANATHDAIDNLRRVAAHASRSEPGTSTRGKACTELHDKCDDVLRLFNPLMF